MELCVDTFCCSLVFFFVRWGPGIKGRLIRERESEVKTVRTDEKSRKILKIKETSVKILELIEIC